MNIQKSGVQVDPNPKYTREWQDVSSPAASVLRLRARVDRGLLTAGIPKLWQHRQIQKRVL